MNFSYIFLFYDGAFFIFIIEKFILNGNFRLLSLWLWGAGPGGQAGGEGWGMSEHVSSFLPASSSWLPVLSLVLSSWGVWGGDELSMSLLFTPSLPNVGERSSGGT